MKRKLLISQSGKVRFGKPAPVGWGVIPAVARALFGWINGCKEVPWAITRAIATAYHTARKQGPEKWSTPQHLAICTAF